MESWTAEIDLAVTRGASFLVGQQETDGRFIDFLMPPGSSDGWITGFVALALDEAARTVDESRYRAAIVRAARALIRAARPTGWGYNGFTATDGDSTSFAIRAIARAGVALSAAPEMLLRHYIDDQGRGHTFANKHRMGNWAGAHADVTPAVGLALHETGAEATLRARVVQASIEARNADGTWRGYWWTQPCYPTWLNLQLLRVSGNLRPAIAKAGVDGLRHLDNLSAMDVASRLGAGLEACLATGDHPPRQAVADLLALQLSDGSWPSSPSLSLPPQRPGAADSSAAPDLSESGEVPVFADVRRLFTTAVAVQVLARYPRQ